MRRILAVLTLLTGACLPLPAQALDARSDIIGGNYDPDAGTFDSIAVINQVIGASIFYNSGYYGQRTNVANVEAGYVWMGHDVFNRTGLADFLAANPLVTDVPATLPAMPQVSGADALGELDFHATMVGSVIAGTGLTADRQDLSALGAGIAPLATLWSGAIATSFATDAENIGSFETSKAAFLVPYRAFFEGTFEADGVTPIVPKADVINSSWGYDDPAGTEEFTQLLDGLARANPTVTLVKSAGNGGPTSAPGGPGSGYNGITVGALGGSSGANAYVQPSDCSSSAPGDFYNPETGETMHGVRAAVDIAAPGDDFALAAYLGKTGSLAGILDESDPASDQFFVNMSGTSFASPIVAGAVSLLKDVALSGNFFAGVEARDTRVIKSVLMAGASPTVGWNNGQHLVDGVLTTTQALDYATGAGALNLENSALIYVGGIFTGGTSDVPGSLGGSIDSVGWDLGTVASGTPNDYFFNLSFISGLELDVSLNWFVNVIFDSRTETAQAQSFANLDLEVWTVSGVEFGALIAQSTTLYNNTEFLRFLLPQTGAYALRVKFTGAVYDQADALTSETYGLAWKVGDAQVTPVPEPGEWSVIIVVALVVIAGVRRRKFLSNAG